MTHADKLREEYKEFSDGGDLFTVSHLRWLERKLFRERGEWEKDRDKLLHEMGILINAPDSPEAKAIQVQWHFAMEVRKAMDSGKPVDIPKLMGVFGKHLYPEQKK